jgi:DNA-binding CsgD family transcriptional regulator
LVRRGRSICCEKDHIDQETAPELTRRERDVLVALCRPLAEGEIFASPASVREIARALVVTDAAVKQHLSHLYDKFGISEAGTKRRAALAREAIRLGAVSLEDLDEAARAAEDAVSAGRHAVGRHEWERAFDLLSEADATRPLEADDLKLLGEAALWANRHDASFAADERAFQEYVRVGDPRRVASSPSTSRFTTGSGSTSPSQRVGIRKRSGCSRARRSVASTAISRWSPRSSAKPAGTGTPCKRQPRE